MPKSTETINDDLDTLLSSHGFEVTPMDSSGQEVPVPSEADIFQFHFHKSGDDYGTVTVTIDGLQRMIVYYDDQVSNSGTSRDDGDISWIELVKQFKKFALAHQLAFELKDTDRLRTDMKRREHTKKLEESVQVDEIFNPTTGLASIMRMIAGVAADVIPAGLAAAGTFAASTAVVGPLAAAMAGSTVGSQIFQTLQNNQSRVPGFVQQLIEKHFGSEQEAQEFALIHAKAAFLGQPKFRWRGQDWQVVLEPNAAEAIIEKGDRYWLEQEMSKRQNQDQLNEGYYGNRKMSYSDDTPRVKMVIKHNKQLEETDQRFRHIERIFLETSDGERFQAPTTKPSRARMFARHIAEGGAYRDDRWSHLQEICEDLDTLGGFVRATTRGREQFNESAQRMISEAVEKYQQLRETVKHLSSGRGYNKYFESYQPSLITETDDTLGEVFKQSTIDIRIESALPVLSKFGIKHTAIAESTMFEEWADNLLGEALDPMTDAQEEALVKLLSNKDLKVGPNGEVAIAELNDIIDSEKLNDELRSAAKQDSNNDAVAVIKSWMERQHNPRYDTILDKFDHDTEVEQDSDNTEPEQVKPKAQAPQQAPAAPGGDMGELPPLPPLPPLAEDSDFVRMLKLSGI
jgi:hypothetical protein